MSKRDITSFFGPSKKVKAAAPEDNTPSVSNTSSPSRALEESVSLKAGGVTPNRLTALDKAAASSSQDVGSSGPVTAISSKSSAFFSGRNSSQGSSAASMVASSGGADNSYIPPIPEAWQAVVGGEASKSYFKNLDRFLASEAAKKKTIYPPKAEIFTALSLCPPSEVRVVILGQDPYHGPGQGHGLAFSVKPGIAIPPSLRNIVKEAMDCGECRLKPSHGTLSTWAAQGVLMLNNVLTVEAAKADSHKGKGWEQFTDAVVRAVSNGAQSKNVVFLLWGKPAQVKGASVNRQKVLSCSGAPATRM